MLGLSWKHWLAIVIGGIVFGLVLSMVLPHGAGIGMRSTHRLAPMHRNNPPITAYLPWILVLGGFLLGVLNRRNTGVLTFAGGAITAGVTLLSSIS